MYGVIHTACLSVRDRLLSQHNKWKTRRQMSAFVEILVVLGRKRGRSTRKFVEIIECHCFVDGFQLTDIHTLIFDEVSRKYVR